MMDYGSALTRERELDDIQDGRSPKRAKVEDDNKNTDASALPEHEEAIITSVDSDSSVVENLLPPSHVLLGASKPAVAPDVTMYRIMEADVGISEYIARDVPEISGIIKQRCVGCLGLESIFTRDVVQVH